MAVLDTNTVIQLIAGASNLSFSLEITTTYIAYNSKMCERVKNREPHPDVLGLLSDGPPRLADKLVCVESDLHPVVEQGEERSERERSHEDRDEAKLQHCIRKISCT